MVDYTHRIRLHFRSISLTDVAFTTILNSAKSVYKRYGIKIEFGSGSSMGLSTADAQRFEQVDGRCRWTRRAQLQI